MSSQVHPPEASIAVLDNDVPPAPTGLRANGNLVDGTKITLRWDPVTGATGYNVRYVEERCPDGLCAPISTEWTVPAAEEITVTPGATVVEARLSGVTDGKLYRFEVRAVVVDSSEWSDLALVFPTVFPIRQGTGVATAPFHGFQEDGRLRYVICGSTIPAGVNAATDDIEDAISEWEESVVWDEGGGNTIRTLLHLLPMGARCADRQSGTPVEDQFQVAFESEREIRRVCDHPFAESGPPACWRSPNWFRPHPIDQIERGAILLNAGRGAAFWNNQVAGGCSKLHEQLVHEAGHAFGIGRATFDDVNRHQTNTEFSIMSYANIGKYCTPQAYDIVAVMALYQSR